MAPRIFGSTIALLLAVAAQAQLHISANIHAGAVVGTNAVQVHLSDHAGGPVKDATVTLNVNMTTMDMGTQKHTATNNSDGTYSANVRFSMAGSWRVTVDAKSPTAGEAKQDFVFTTGQGEMHEEHAMRGRLGDWSMTREGSGTSWLPLSSPMYMKHLGMAGRYEQTAMGFITYNFTDAGGDRGEQRFYSNSMLMLMGVDAGERETSGYSVMLSLDPLFNGRYGYPNLFQTGETAYGAPLTDFQHPHDLFVEVAGTHSREISRGLRGFVYAAPVGEPALGGPTFMHRPSGVEIPEAPIGHHWFDATHISWGVVTLGANTDKWQLEGSVFNGHEPDENRYSPDNLSLNSVSGRFTQALSDDFVWNVAYGFLDEPESLEPGVHQHRVTASALWNKPLSNDANLAVGAAFGRNYKEGEFGDALLLEATYSKGDDTFFARWEGVDKDELMGVPPGTYKVNKFLFGGVREVKHFDGLDLGVGGYVGFYSFPSSLEPFYGKSPLTVGAFVRLRPSRMQSSARAMHMGH